MVFIAVEVDLLLLGVVAAVWGFVVAGVDLILLGRVVAKVNLLLLAGVCC